MTFEQRSLRTAEGLIDYDIVRCDGPNCPTAQTTTTLMGWLQLKGLGVAVKTLGGGAPLPAEFCSRPCLLEWLNEGTR